MTELTIYPNGVLSLEKNRRTYIKPSPVGHLVQSGEIFAPLSAEPVGNTLTLHFTCGNAVVQVEQKGGYHKLTLLSVPAESSRFIFGPYETNGVSCGEILGAAWFEDGAAACIQSLMPKVEGGVPGGEIDGAATAAAQGPQGITLQCTVTDRSKPSRMDYLGYRNTIVKAVSGPDSQIEGASVALIGAESAEELLDIISDMELEEGLPHPMFKGNYAKRDPRASGIYLIFEGGDISAERRIELAKRAGVSCVYLSDVFDKWGHFTPNTGSYPGGIAELRELSDKAWKSGITLGIHVLSNFIHTHDDYVTPVPHEKLLVMDETMLSAPLSVVDTEIFVRDANNFGIYDMNIVRLGDELIEYEAFDAEKLCLTGCRRGAYGTAIDAYPAGMTLSRLWCHGYRTLFPDIELQDEMADNLAQFIKDCRIRRISFDGLEGCSYTGTNEYGPSEYVRRIYEKVGTDMISDASISGHYLWHTNAYYNWGEPWYDHVRRGGMHHFRVCNGEFFRRNLIPPMMGWYMVASADGKFEAATPENIEFAISRSAAFDAGLAINFCSGVVGRHGLIDKFADMIRCWEDLRFHGQIPAHVLERLREENSNWHLEGTDDGWRLTELILRTQDLSYGDREIKTEAGMIYRKDLIAEGDRFAHCSRVMLDAPYGEQEEPVCFRIRVGHVDHGMIEDLCIANGLTGENLGPDALRFKVSATGGDYLEYRGGNELWHYDPHFKLKDIIESAGVPVVIQPRRMGYITLTYLTDKDPLASYMLTEIRRRNEFSILRKQE